MLTKDHTGDVCSVTRHQPTASNVWDQSLQPGESRTIKTGVRLIHCSVKDGDAYAGISKGLCPERLEPRQCPNVRESNLCLSHYCLHWLGVIQVGFQFPETICHQTKGFLPFLWRAFSNFWQQNYLNISPIEHENLLSIKQSFDFYRQIFRSKAKVIAFLCCIRHSQKLKTLTEKGFMYFRRIRTALCVNRKHN